MTKIHKTVSIDVKYVVDKTIERIVAKHGSFAKFVELAMEKFNSSVMNS